MKELYEAPEATLIAFVASKSIAATDWDWSDDVEGSTGSEIDAGFDGDNPEGNFK